MPKRTKQEVVAEFRWSEILDAARTVFSKRGFNDVTVYEIAADAGQASFGGDLVDSDVVEAALAEDGARGVEDFRTAELGDNLLFGTLGHY